MTTTLSAPPSMLRFAVPDAVWSGLLGGLATGVGPFCSLTSWWVPLSGLATSPQTIGSNCASGVRVGPLWTLMYQVPLGIPPSLMFGTEVTESATPLASACTLFSP